MRLYATICNYRRFCANQCNCPYCCIELHRFSYNFIQSDGRTCIAGPLGPAMRRLLALRLDTDGQGDAMGEQTRSMSRRIKVALTADERATLDRHAAAVGMPLAMFLRNVGLGSQPRCVLDDDTAVNLVRVASDQYGVAMVLKAWLASSPSPAAPPPEVRALVQEIEALHRQLRAMADKVLW